MSKRYFGIFVDAEAVARNFQIQDERSDMHGLVQETLLDKEIIFASYDYEDYSGRALVLLRRNGKLFEVHGSHCSCNGLEGQWKPEETSWAALAMRDWEYVNISGADVLQKLITRHLN